MRERAFQKNPTSIPLADAQDTVHRFQHLRQLSCGNCLHASTRKLYCLLLFNRLGGRVMKRQTYGLIAATLLACTSSVRAGPVLLWTLGLSGNVTTPPQSDQRVQFILQSSPGDGSSGINYDLASPFLEAGDKGIFRFDSGSSTGFSDLANLMTNGHNDELGILWRWANNAFPFPCAGQGGTIG